jgi:hypothetical protein
MHQTIGDEFDKLRLHAAFAPETVRKRRHRRIRKLFT